MTLPFFRLGTLAYTENDGSKVIDAELTITDEDDANIASPPSLSLRLPIVGRCLPPIPMTSMAPGINPQAS